MEISKNEIEESLLTLVETGEIWASCPHCTIPLSFKEYKKKNCSTCGKFDLNEVKFYPKSNSC